MRTGETYEDRFRHRPRYRHLLSLLAIAAGVAALLVFVSARERVGADEPASAVSIWQVSVSGPADAERLLDNGYDVLEGRGPGYLLVMGEASVAAQLRSDGFSVELDRSLPAVAPLAPQDNAGFAPAAFFGGYRSVEEHDAHLAEVAATYPDLATVYDYGDSWNKINGRSGPNELMVICLTNKQAGDCELNPDSDKPRAVIQAAIHARELQTSEVAWRLIDELTSLYGVDGDITHVMDTTETWIIPVVNPDGREIVESGGNSPYLQRKNANDTVGSCSNPPSASNHHGVDLNRNATWGWGGNGVSSNPCAQTYNGTGPASEPEQEALEDLFAALWPAQKGPNSNDPVPSTATGSFITIHSYGELILLPQNDDGLAPNDTELRKFAFRMAHYNGYVTGTGPEILYGASGTTDDHAYYAHGAASFTYELSPVNGPCSGFTPNYSCIDSEIWPLNRDALLYSIKVAGAPYVTPQGPTLTELTVPAEVNPGVDLELYAVASDAAYGTAAGSVGRPSAQDVVAMEYYLDVGPAGIGEPIAMVASDGNFDEPTEAAVSVVDTTGLAPGRHLVRVRAQNLAGFWGPFAAVHIDVVNAGDADCSGGPLTVADVQFLLDYLVGNRSAAPCPLAQPDRELSLTGADRNNDGSVDLLDALVISQCVRGFDNAFC